MSAGGWLLNSGLFYFGWIYTIKSVLDGSPLKGVLVSFLIVACHLWRSKERRFEILLMVTFPLLGSLFDTALSLLGILTYEGTYRTVPWIAPLWVTALWALFATSLNHSLAWVGRAWWLASACGAIGGTLSYLAVIKAGAAHFAIAEPYGIASLALAWALILPLCYCYNRWLKGYFAGS